METVKRSSPNMPNWSELYYDILVQIFSKMTALDRITNVAEVCSSWRKAVSDKKFHNTLDISKCRQHATPRNSRGTRSQLLQLAFIRGINFGNLNLTTLVFDPPFYVSNRHLLYASQRCPNLKELELPFPSCITYSGLKRTFRSWPKLESLFLAFNFLGHPPIIIFKIVRGHYPNLSVLKVHCCFLNIVTMSAVTRYMPRLKVLSIRCELLITNVVEAFSRMEQLEEGYISAHNIGTNIENFPDLMLLSSVVDNARDMRRLPRLRVCHVCYWEKCFSCMAATMGNTPLLIPNPFEN